ncbi:MAG: phage integrase N-terminal SAM-like domain-containing protein [Gammaproteobacteria bacterium]|nr:phage integrase N-terminal SAM-like domain-containing protein [Gammaproteobacteria bacterium]
MEDLQNETQMLFSKLVDAFKLHRFKREDAQDYLNWIKFFLKHYHKKSPSSLDAEDVKAFLKYLCDDKGLMPSRQKQAYQAINFFYNNVLKRSLWSTINSSENTDNLSALQVPSTIDNTRNDESVDWINLLKEPFQLIASLRFQCGLKVEEVLNIRLEDINFDRQFLRIRDAFGNYSEIKMSPDLSKSVKQQFEKSSHSLALDKKGKNLFKTPSALSRNQLTDNDKLYFLFPGTLQLNIQTQKRVRESLDALIVEQAFQEARTRKNQQKLRFNQSSTTVKTAAL